MDKEVLKTNILEIISQGKISKEDLQKKIQIDDNELEEILEILLKEAEIYLNKQGYYTIFDKENYFQGIIKIVKDGSGYVIGKKDGKKVKYKIKKSKTKGALDDDVVIIKTTKNENYDCLLGTVEQIIKRNKSHVYTYIGKGLFKLCNNNSEIFMRIEEKECEKIVRGTLVIGQISNIPIIDNIYDGEIRKLCGHIDDPNSIIKAIGFRYGFDDQFNYKAIKEAEKLPTKVHQEDLEDRIDLRNENIFTIDCATTKDIDDAISIQKDGKNYILKGHIADVAHYIEKSPLLMHEAKLRGNSAYLADTVFPMFPHIISNGICSLNPNVDRLTLTVEIHFDQFGHVINSEIYESVIKSKKQMTYDDVNKIFAKQHVKGYENFANDLFIMRDLYKLLEKNRKENGALEFNDHELNIISDYQNEIVSITQRKSGEAEKLIENFMIAINQEVVKHFGYLDMPFIYRVHQEPNINKLLATLEIIKEDGIDNQNINKLIIELQKNTNNKGSYIKPVYIEKVLSSIKGEKYYDQISNLILKSMKRAVYSNENIGHFGLATDHYTHFTSPIRRYADLENHRIIKLLLEYYRGTDEKRTKEIFDKLDEIKKDLNETCIHISETEKMADEAEIKVDKIKTAEYFNNNIFDYEGPIQAKIIRISKTGITAAFDVFTVFIPKIDLDALGYKYKKESRMYLKKDEVFKVGSEVYLFYPEVTKGQSDIIYHNISSNVDNLIIEKTRQKKKTIKIN